jgi:hypothetical protein
MAGFGLKVARTAGAALTTALDEYPISPSYTGIMAAGDPVRLVSGFLQAVTNTAGNFPDTDVIGVFVGCRYVEADGDTEFTKRWDGVAGRTDIFAHVVPAAGRRFYIKGSSSVTWTAADIGTSRRLIFAASSAALKESRVTLGAVGVPATAPLTGDNGHAFIHALASIPGNGYTADGVTEPIFEVTLTRVQGGLAVPYVTT